MGERFNSEGSILFWEHEVSQSGYMVTTGDFVSEAITNSHLKGEIKETTVSYRITSWHAVALYLAWLLILFSNKLWIELLHEARALPNLLDQQRNFTGWKLNLIVMIVILYGKCWALLDWWPDMYVSER